MDKFEYAAGSEEIFLDFIENLSEKDNIGLISHTDLDGITSAKVVYDSLKNDFNIKLIKFVNYDEINDKFVSEIKKSRCNKLIFTDLAIDDVSVIKRLEKFSSILILDHHLFNEDLNSQKTSFIDIQGQCAAYICYKLFSKVYDIEVLDWVVACGCVADWAYFNNREFMARIFKKYGDKFEFVDDNGMESIRKSGKFWELQWDLSLALIYFKDDVKRVFESVGNEYGEVGDLRKYSKEVQKEIDRGVEEFEKEKEDYGDVYLWEYKNGRYSVRSIISTLTSAKYIHKTIIILNKKEDKYIISTRRQDKRVNVTEFLQKLLNGFKGAFAGGHVAAGGGHFFVKDLEKFKGNLKRIKF